MGVYFYSQLVYILSDRLKFLSFFLVFHYGSVIYFEPNKLF
ncbi:hypothetical protein XBJ2_390015 [Xenorhabdus bovienii str. Jollieti]|nr:hypothetical protein XBJ2_390015 [Xenorhabdus bovienii str. Jollieti]